MAISKAKYVTGENSKVLIITPSEIKDRIDYSKNYKNHLYCSEKGCEAQLNFVQVYNF